MSQLLARCSLHCDLPDVGEGIALREVVGVPFPEDVAHPAAGHDLQAPTAHPHPEGELCGRRQPSGGKGSWQGLLAFGVSSKARAGLRVPAAIFTGYAHP